MNGIEVNLRCGDTITVPTMPAIGAYRYCEHCDGRRQVIGVPVIERPTYQRPTLGELQAMRNRIGDHFIAGTITEHEWRWQLALADAMVDRIIYNGPAVTCPR